MRTSQRKNFSAIAPATATRAPTDKSVPPNAITRVIPIEIIVISAERFTMSIKLP